MAYAGDRVGALLLLEKNSALLPFSGRENIRGAWWMLALVVEGLFMLGEQVQAGRLYPLVRELIDTGAVVGWPIPRYTQTIAGLAAAGHMSGKPPKSIFASQGGKLVSFPIASNRQRYAASTQ